jgi:hypothetical protein
MAARIIRVAGLVVLAAALSAPLASAMRVSGDEGGSLPAQPASRYLDTPALDQGMQQSTAVAPNDRATQGIGQTSSAPAAEQRDIQAANGAGATLVIPYLSHGAGVDAAQFSGQLPRPDDRAGVRPSVPTDVPSSFAVPVSTTGNGFDWGTAGIGAAGLAALALAIGFLVVLGRRSRGHEDVAVS